MNPALWLRNGRLALGLGLTVCALVVMPGCMLLNPKYVPAYGGGEAQLFDGMGPHTREITTDSAEAQAYFDQGLNWVYGFNHDEAVRCFTKAAELDPDCAMAWWGIAYAQGPNYNMPLMGHPKSTKAWNALQEALARVDRAAPVERALIEALATRYRETEPEERMDLDKAFSEAMAKVWIEFPGDGDVGTIYAESMMIRFPWKLYKSDETPARKETGDIVRILEEVMASHPNHPGGLHLYIHAVEPSADKERAIPAADRLSHLVPASGHLLHMPSHIYAQVGKWDESVEQNVKALAADTEYREKVSQPGLQFGYMMHNSHMLAFSAMMVGREEQAMGAAQAMWDDVPAIAKFFFGAFVDPVMCSVYDVQKRFGRWDDILAEPAPPGNMPITTAVWRAHRAIAYAAKKDFDRAEREQMAFRAAMKKVPHKMEFPPFAMTIKFLLTSELFVEGEIALQKGNWEEAAESLEAAVEIEDTLGYGEPPLWLQPARHALGAVYMKWEKYDEAERVYREDLDKWPRNGWSLFGLSRALQEQGKTAEANQVKSEFEQVWAGADEPIETSCKCIPKL